MNLRRKQRIENFNKGNEQKGKKGKESYTKNARIREQQIFRNLGSGGQGVGWQIRPTLMQLSNPFKIQITRMLFFFCW
jgi:hypothetical protein